MKQQIEPEEQWQYTHTLLLHVLHLKIVDNWIHFLLPFGPSNLAFLGSKKATAALFRELPDL